MSDEEMAARVARLEAWVEVIMRMLAMLGLEALLIELDEARRALGRGRRVMSGWQVAVIAVGALTRELNAYRRQHPGVTIKGPLETLSHLWEVSFPRAATMAFDDPELMLRPLRMTSTPKE